MGTAVAEIAPSLRRVERIMGTVIGVDVRGSGPDAAGADLEVGVEAAFAHLRDVDRRFSPYRDDSEIERIGRGELRLAEASPDVRVVADMAAAMREETDGAFDAWGHRPGRFDPTGLVKGWALDGAAAILREAGATAFVINGGGDIIAAGEAAPGRPWRIGIRHPRRADRVAAVIHANDLAVATSATYERGAHIVVPATGRPPAGLLSVTVAAETLARADALATAVYAMGPAGPRWFAARPGAALLAITTDQRVLVTPAMDGFLVDEQAPSRTPPEQ